MYCTAVRRHKLLLLSMCRVFYFQYSSIILTGLWASNGVTRSYSSHFFLCALDKVHVHVQNYVRYKNFRYTWQAARTNFQCYCLSKRLSIHRHKQNRNNS